jgi:hypothetical protein
MRRHTPRQQLSEAKQIARDHGMFVLKKDGKLLLYREATPRNVYVGMRSEIGAFRSFVARCAESK